MSETKKILIIEDDVDLVEAMKLILESHKYQVLAEYTPDKGFQLAEREKPDLIILDVMFGSDEKTHGFDYAVKFRQSKKLSSIPILMISAVNMEHPGFHFSNRDYDEYMPVDAWMYKPAQPEDLILNVNSLINKGISNWANWPYKN